MYSEEEKILQTIYLKGVNFQNITTISETPQIHNTHTHTPHRKCEPSQKVEFTFTPTIL